MRNKNSISSNYAQLMLETDHAHGIKENTMEMLHIINRWKN